MTGSSKQTTTTNTAPWPGAQPALNTALAGAQNLYNNGIGGATYYGSTVVPWDAKTVQGQNIITNAANANSGGKGTSAQYQGVINSGGYNPAQLTALQNTKDLANSTFNVDNNPAFRNVLQQATDSATNAVNGNASAAGRYGSGTNQQLLGTTVGNVAGQLTNNEYQNWQNRRDAANSNLFNMGQTGFGNLGTAYSGLQAPANDLMKVGAMNEDLATRNINDQLRMFDSYNNKPWENLARLNGIASGAGQLGGTSTQSQPGQNPFLTALGYGATGAGLLGSFL